MGMPNMVQNLSLPTIYRHFEYSFKTKTAGLASVPHSGSTSRYRTNVLVEITLRSFDILANISRVIVSVGIRSECQRSVEIVHKLTRVYDALEFHLAESWCSETLLLGT